MFKNLFLATTVTLFSLSLSAESIDRITEIQDTLEHIAEEKNVIMLEGKTALLLIQESTNHFQQALQEHYQSMQQKCIQLLNIIVSSTEFTTTLDQVTDEQTTLIIEQKMKFNDLMIDPSAYPLEKKLNDELAIAALDEQTEQLFNVYYVVYAIICGSKKLLKKLDLKSQELTTELEALSNPS